MALETEMKQEKGSLSSAMKTTFLWRTLTSSYRIGDFTPGHPPTENTEIKLILYWEIKDGGTHSLLQKRGQMPTVAQTMNYFMLQ